MSRASKPALFLIVLSLAAACTGGGNGDGGDGQAGTGAGNLLVAIPSEDPDDIALRQRQAKAFMAKYPEVKVKLLTIPGQGYDQKVVTMIAGGKPPDVFVSGDVQIPTIVRKRYALDLASFIERDRYDLSDFYPQVVQGLTFDGRVVGLADNWDTQVLYYNKTLFDRAKVDHPNGDWTWEDLLAAARKLTSGGGGEKRFGVTLDPWFAPLFDQIWAFGGKAYSDDGRRCELTTPQAIAGIDSIRQLFQEGLAASPGQLEQLGQDTSQLFLAGRAAMNIGSGRWAASEFKDVKQFEWRVAPLPRGPAGRANFFHLSMFAVAANTKNPEGAWKFLQYLVSPEGMRQAVRSTQGIPSRRSLVADPAFAQTEFVKEHNAWQPFLDSLPTAHPAPYVSNFFLYQDKVDAAMDAVWAGRKTAAEVVGGLCKDIDRTLAAEAGP